MRFSKPALQRAAELILARPEKQGMLSRAVRHICGLSVYDIPQDSVTIETHFDAVSVPEELGNQLLQLGFELDGFDQFVPRHFGDDFTLKYKLDIHKAVLRRQLQAEMKEICRAIERTLVRDWPNLEAYLETEIYTNRNRRVWKLAALKTGWRERLPYRKGASTWVVPPKSPDEITASGLSLESVKRADIHTKISHDSDPMEREALIAEMKAMGFYTVRTWAANDICTGQFLHTRDSNEVFRGLSKFFDENGGCSEITLEIVTAVWRSSRRCEPGLSLSAMPPVIIQIS